MTHMSETGTTIRLQKFGSNFWLVCHCKSGTSFIWYI